MALGGEECCRGYLARRDQVIGDHIEVGASEPVRHAARIAMQHIHYWIAPLREGSVRGRQVDLVRAPAAAERRTRVGPLRDRALERGDLHRLAERRTRAIRQDGMPAGGEAEESVDNNVA